MNEGRRLRRVGKGYKIRFLDIIDLFFSKNYTFFFILYIIKFSTTN